MHSLIHYNKQDAKLDQKGSFDQICSWYQWSRLQSLGMGRKRIPVTCYFVT